MHIKNDSKHVFMLELGPTKITIFCDALFFSFTAQLVFKKSNFKDALQT